MRTMRWLLSAVVVWVAVSLMLPTKLSTQTANMGRTWLNSQNVRYANEGGTGTTVNKLAKLTGAPSTAIITATTDTSGIVGIVVAGAGTTGSADVAVAGKASCDFDSATTAGHYVVNDTSTAGDCMDGGATYPTSGQVIGVVTSTNGGAGTYEVDLSVKQAQAGGGSGASITSGAYASLPATCATNDLYIPTDSNYSLLRCMALNTWTHFLNGRQLTPPVLADFAWVNQGTGTAVNTFGGVYLTAPATAADHFRILKKAAPGGAYSITALVIMNFGNVSYNLGGLLFRASGTGKMHVFYLSSDTTSASRCVMHSAKVNDADAAGFAEYGTATQFPKTGMLWLRIEDTGADRITSYSYDGKSFKQYSTIGRTDFITADEVGFFTSSSNAAVGSDLWVLNWN